MLNLFYSPFIYRLYPVVIGNGRNLQSDAVIAGYHVPKGVSHLGWTVHLSKWGLHYWHQFEFHTFHHPFFTFSLCYFYFLLFNFVSFSIGIQTHVIFPHLAVSNSDEYFPEPKRFLPERWIKRGELSMRNNYNHFRTDGGVHLLMKCH